MLTFIVLFLTIWALCDNISIKFYTSIYNVLYPIIISIFIEKYNLLIAKKIIYFFYTVILFSAIAANIQKVL